MASSSRSERRRRSRASDDAALRLGFYIHDTSRLRKLVYDAAFRPAGVTRAQAAVLSYLWGEDDMSQSQLARRLDLGKVALGSLVDKLELAGMVARAADADDRRAKRITLTAKGRRTFEQLRELGRAANERVLAGLSDDDIVTTTNALRRMKSNLIAILDDEGSD